MPLTMTQKILSAAIGGEVVPGDVLSVPVSGISIHDRFPLAFFEAHPEATLWDPSKVVICYDHFNRSGMGVDQTRMRKFSKDQGIPAENIFSGNRQGISHQVPGEEGFVLPGSVYAVFDTQGSTLGALNAFAFTSLLTTPSVLVLGRALIVAPEIVDVELVGQLGESVTSKDLTFYLQEHFADKISGRVLEFRGTGVASLSIDQRLGIANAANNLGALTMLFPGDEVLDAYLKPRTRVPYTFVSADKDALFATKIVIDLATVSPLVSGPKAIEEIQSLDAVIGLPVEAAYLGSCSAGRIDDLALAAKVLEGRKVSPSVRFIITPISSEVLREANDRGFIATFLAAGALVTPPGCGACYIGNASPLLLEEGERCIASSVSNNPGRMGSKEAEIYLSNPAVVAASAIEGRIADPKPYLSVQGVSA